MRKGNIEETVVLLTRGIINVVGGLVSMLSDSLPFEAKEEIMRLSGQPFLNKNASMLSDCCVKGKYDDVSKRVILTLTK